MPDPTDNPFLVPPGAEPLAQTSIRMPVRLKQRINDLARLRGRTFSELMIFLLGAALDEAERVLRDQARKGLPPDTPHGPGIQLNPVTGLRIRRRRRK